MNNDLISRSALKKELSKRLWFVSSPETDAQAIKDIIDNAPTVSLPEQSKSGHWVEENINAGIRKVFCSECGCPPPFEHISTGDVYSASGYGTINKTKFCPNCGADMRGDKE